MADLPPILTKDQLGSVVSGLSGATRIGVDAIGNIAAGPLRTLLGTIVSRLPPSGGTTGQALKKNSDNDHDYSWGEAGGPSAPFSDATALVKDDADATKLVRVDVGNVAPGTMRTLTMPDANVNLAADQVAANASPRTLGSGTAQAAPGGHVGSRDGHPLATTILNGLMPGADKALLSNLPQFLQLPPNWTNYSLTIVANTWTRLVSGGVNTPRITLPAVGAPPTGYKWVVTVRGFLRFIPIGAGGKLFVNIALNNGAMSTVNGGGVVNQDIIVPVLATYDVPDPTASFTVDFGIYGPADTYSVPPAAKPEANVYLVRV